MPLPRVARTSGGHVWGETWRLLVAFVFGLAVWGAVQAQLDYRGADPAFGKNWLLVDLALGVASTVLLLWRRRWPLAVAVITAAVSGISSVSVGASAVALVSLATRRRWRELAIVAVPWTLAGISHALVYPTEGVAVTLPNIIIGVLSFAVSVAIGWAIGERRAFVASLHERALTAEREQSMRVVQAQLGERARIAREMHDVLAHRISLVAMHSGALAYRTDLSPQEVRDTAEIVRDSANRALTELRAVLGVLRDVPGPESGAVGGVGAGAAGGAGAEAADRQVGRQLPEPPQPTLRDLDTLVAEATSAGALVALERSGDVAEVPDAVSRSAYRIVQECLTNARKHAPGARALVRVDVDADRGRRDHDGRRAVLVTVRNGIPPRDDTEPAPPGAGLGLIGLTERAVLGGGELTYGRDRRGDFLVSARLPWAS
ncbi:MAG TPA: histidine kinase [Humibacillus xanthopallidus]|nr:histidine kinase [Humibacillus xanthopallidus]